MTTSIAVGIAHAAFDSDRGAPFGRLLQQLAPGRLLAPHVSRSESREPARVWAKRLWEWAATRTEDAVILLNDDVTVCPDLIAQVESIVKALPEEIISLHCQLPAAKALAAQGEKWLRSYWCSGPGYVLPRGTAAKLLDWMARTPDSILDAWNEDGYVNMYAWAQRRPIWHCIPALVQHDTAVPSTLGYDQHDLRVATAPWTEVATPSDWRPHGEPTFHENPWMNTDRLVKLDHARRRGDRFRLMIATPHRGSINPATVLSVQRLQRVEGLDVPGGPWSTEDLDVSWIQSNYDLVRARSRFVRMAIESLCTHLLFVDGDIEFDPHAVVRMLLSGEDYIACPYPRRDGTGYNVVRRQDGAIQPEEIDPHDVCSIDGTGMGLTLLSRRCLVSMTTHYSLTLPHFQDRLALGSPPVRTLALFHLLHRNDDLYGEDITFATRWKDMGGRVGLYLGQGSPAVHHGDFAYQGRVEDFGITLLPAAEAGAT